MALDVAVELQTGVPQTTVPPDACDALDDDEFERMLASGAFGGDAVHAPPGSPSQEALRYNTFDASTNGSNRQRNQPAVESSNVNALDDTQFERMLASGVFNGNRTPANTVEWSPMNIRLSFRILFT